MLRSIGSTVDFRERCRNLIRNQVLSGRMQVASRTPVKPGGKFKLLNGRKASCHPHHSRSEGRSHRNEVESRWSREDKATGHCSPAAGDQLQRGPSVRHRHDLPQKEQEQRRQQPAATRRSPKTVSFLVWITHLPSQRGEQFRIARNSRITCGSAEA